MPTDFKFREQAVKTLTSKKGVYVLCDLDNVPIYVGQGQSPKGGIRERVRRHLTSARTDIIANRQIDVWEIAFVRTYPVANLSDIATLESQLFHEFNPTSPLMNGKSLPPYTGHGAIPTPAQEVQVMSDAEIAEKKDPSLRLPRQAGHYAQIVGHYLAVKESKEIARAMDAHFQRLKKYHAILLNIAKDEPPADDEGGEE